MSNSKSAPEQLPSPHIPPLTMQLVRFLVLVVMVGFGIHLLLPQLAGLEHSWSVVRSMPIGLLLLAAAVQVCSYVGSGLMFHALARLAGDHLSIRRGMVIAVAGPSFGMIAGGTFGNSAITYHWVRGSGASRMGAALCATVSPALVQLMLLLVSLVGMVTLFFQDQLTLIEVASFTFLLFVLVGLAAVAIWGMAHPNELTDRLTPLLARYRAWRHQPFDPNDVVEQVDQLVSCSVVLRTGWHGPVAGTALNIGFDILTLFVLFMAAGYQVPPNILLAGYGLPLLIGRIPITPGGVGVVEATMTAVFIGLGAPNGPTVVAVLAYRLLTFWVPGILGFPLAAYLQRVTRPAAQLPDNGPNGAGLLAPQAASDGVGRNQRPGAA